MSFLNTTILFLSALALIPILIHLFNRQRVKRIQFSSIRYLKTLQKTKMRRLKIRQLILLILRTLIILALVAAFARPTTKGSYSSKLGSAAEASVVLMIDNSLSMLTETPEGSLFELAKIKALDILKNIASGDNVAVISFNQTVKNETNGFTSNMALAENVIGSLDATNMATEPMAALESALNLLVQSNDLIHEIYILSDLAGNNWRDMIYDNLPDNERLKIYVTKFSKKDYDNLKVTKIDFANSLIYPGRPVKINSEITNEGSRRMDNLLISLYIDKKRIAQSDLSILPSSSEKTNFTYTFTSPGEHTGFIEITDDDLLEDNRRYFTINIPNVIRVLTLFENENDDLFLKMAFKPLPESPSQIEVSSEPVSRLTAIDLDYYDCIILSRSAYLSQAGFSRLANYTKAGGSLLLFLSNENNKKAINDKLLIPAFGNRIDNKMSVKEGEGFYRLGSIDFGHPIFSRLKEVNASEIPEISFFNILKASSLNKGKILASFSSGTPAIVENDWGNGKIMAVFSSPSGEDSDLAAHPFFVTFVNRAVEFLAYDLTRLKENYYTGNKITKTLLDINPQKSVEILTPSGAGIFPEYTFSGTELNLNIPPIDNAGICEIMVDENVTERFAVNFNPDESSGKFISVGDISKILNKYEIIELPAEKESQLVIQESRLGKELSKVFFILALVFIAAEMLLARGGAQPQKNDT